MLFLWLVFGVGFGSWALADHKDARAPLPDDCIVALSHGDTSVTKERFARVLRSEVPIRYGITVHGYFDSSESLVERETYIRQQLRVITTYFKSQPQTAEALRRFRRQHLFHSSLLLRAKRVAHAITQDASGERRIYIFPSSNGTPLNRYAAEAFATSETLVTYGWGPSRYDEETNHIYLLFDDISLGFNDLSKPLIDQARGRYPFEVLIDRKFYLQDQKQEHVNWRPWIGKRALVRLNATLYYAGANQPETIERYKLDVLSEDLFAGSVTTEEGVRTQIKEQLEALRQESALHPLRDLGAIIMRTNSGVWHSKTFLSNDQGRFTLKEFRQALNELPAPPSFGVKYYFVKTTRDLRIGLNVGDVANAHSILSALSRPEIQNLRFDYVVLTGQTNGDVLLRYSP